MIVIQSTNTVCEKQTLNLMYAVPCPTNASPYYSKQSNPLILTVVTHNTFKRMQPLEQRQISIPPPKYQNPK